jgi:hypothetical protein
VAPGGKWISSIRIPEKLALGKEKLKSLFRSIKHVSATIDICSDRRMRGYMGITVYWLEEPLFNMKMAVLDAIRIKGSHTAINMMENFDVALLDFGINCKSVRVVSDDAANMKKAFQLQLLVPNDEPNQQIQEMDTVPDALHDIDSDDELKTAEMDLNEHDLTEQSVAEQEALEEQLSKRLDAMFSMSDSYKCRLLI